MDTLRKQLAEVESAIIAIAGDNIDSYNLDSLSRDYRDEVEELLDERNTILNRMFQPTEENMRRFRDINQRLFELTQNLHKRVKIMAAKTSSIVDFPGFDDDFEIEGWRRFVFDDEESVLKLPDDEYYGSRIAVMIKILYELYKDKHLENIESAYPCSEPLDDGVSWNEPPYWGKPEFDDIVICHAVHDLTNHKAYSIPDLVRLNDFWCEVQLNVQSITDQKGKHFRFFEDK